jgi:hypothetical protein
MTSALTIWVVATLTLLLGPLALGIAGWIRSRKESRPPVDPTPWVHTALVSALACTLAFNLTFFIQELFLVLPKALTPGLQPTLFHNNHTWSGQHPLAELFQGTGAVATILSGSICAMLVARGAGRTQSTRLLLLWMVYCGFLMALPQVVVGALSAASDLGRTLIYLQAGEALKVVLALLALVAMPLIGLRLARAFLALAPAAPVTAAGRSGWIFRVATLPALLSVVLLVPFRVPREFIEVVVVPLAVMVAGVPWIQAGAAWQTNVAPHPARPVSLGPLWIATLLLLAIFQLVLRRGVTL